MMTYENQVESLDYFVSEGHTISLPGSGIRLFARKNKFCVKTKKETKTFDSAEKAATFYRQETHAYKMDKACEYARKKVESWPAWKRTLLGSSS